MRKKNILEILRNPDISGIEKKIAAEKWKFNQLPVWYRKGHISNIKEKIRKLKEKSGSNVDVKECIETEGA